MKILDKLSRVLGSRTPPRSEPESHVLDPFEIRLIAEGKLERLGDFAASVRLCVADPKGDTPLHLAARTGNLALCDFFIRFGANPDALNHERQTPADVAFSEGHGLAAQLLYSLVTKSQTREKAEVGDITPRPETGTPSIDAVSKDRFTSSPQQKSDEILRTVSEPFEGSYWTEERREELARLWSLGAEPGQIAKKLGGLLTTGAILNEIHRLGILKLRETTSERPDFTRGELIGETVTTSAWPDEQVDLLKRMWAEGQSASQIARALGGVSRNAVLSKVHRLSLSHERQAETGLPNDMISNVRPAVALPPVAGPLEQPSPEIAQTSGAPKQLDDLEDLLGFEAADEPEQFFRKSVSETVSGTFVALVSPAPVVSDDEEGGWDLDLSPASITGEGIGTAAITTDHAAEHDFLKVRNRGRQSVKRAVVQTGTRLSIDPEICITWADETLAKQWYSFSDIESLVELCEGDGDLEELRTNLLRNLEAGDLEPSDQIPGEIVGVWDTRSDISFDDLSESIEAALTRSTQLPGTQRFVMDKSDERQLLEPMVRAKQELQLGILASEAAVQTILDVVDNIRGGVRDPASVSLRNIIPSRPGHTETAEVMASAEALKYWQANGRVMDGKRRREALAALEALDLSLAFHKELVRSLEQKQENSEHANWLDLQISVFEAANEHLILDHLPYARRFAARNVEEGEDPEDVFQVAFMGLQRSTRRFDSERGYRFVIYASYWMRQAIMRWRADEGTAIRIPVHRKEKIAKLDLALEKLDVRLGSAVPDEELAAELEWTSDDVRQFRDIPREAEYPKSIDEWDDLLPEPEEAHVFDQAETERIITDALAELPDRQADVIRMRFGIGRDADMTLEEIGQIYGVTRERIRQIEAKALDRLSHPGRKRRLQELLGR